MKVIISYFRMKFKIIEHLVNFVERNTKLRFYQQLVQAAIESTRTLLLAPDVNGGKHNSQYPRYNPMPCASDSNLSEICEMEQQKTISHLNSLAHFREMIKSLNKLRKKGSRIFMITLKS